jgi:hypothetical protein
MLYFYEYLEDHPIQTLHYFIEHFFEQIHAYAGEQFTPDLLHPDFKPIAETYKTVLMIPLRQVFEEYRKLPQEERDKIYYGFKVNNDIGKLCQGEGEPVRYRELSGEIKTALKQLFNNLYKQVLNRKAYCTRYGDQGEHYKKFCELNREASVCPFCGLEDLPSEHDSYRADYDHFLVKVEYPFSSVNFRNLVPMGHICNSKFKKQKNILFRDNDKKRRRKVFYPYETNSKNYAIEVQVKESDGESAGTFNIEINGPADRQQEIKSWDEIFEIKTRYGAKIKERSKSWVSHFMLRYKEWREGKASTEFGDFVHKIREELASVKLHDKAFLQKSYFEYLAADEAFEENLNATIGS